MTLHITNGDAAGTLLKGTPGVEGDILPWRDVLHEGPVPAGLSLEELSLVRADFLSFSLKFSPVGGGHSPDRETIRADFQTRDRRLHATRGEDEAVLWFEHDLYDQLQLIQILDWFHRAGEAGGPKKLSLICIDHFDGVPWFDGFGVLTPEQMALLLPAREPVTPTQMKTATKAWAAFRQDDPGALVGLLQADLSPLPFLNKALWRLCREYPWVKDGLTLTQRRLLTSLADPAEELPRLAFLMAERDVDWEPRYREIMAGPLTFRRVFHNLMHLEEHPFMGDHWAAWLLGELALGEEPLVRVSLGGTEPSYAITGAGREILAGERPWAPSPGFDCWRGGVHIHPGGRWLWDEGGNAFRPAGQG